MFLSAKKIIAVLMLLWLPVFTGSALAASVSMQLPHGECHEVSMSQNMSNMDMDEDQMHYSGNPMPESEHSACGVCHFVCMGYLPVPAVEMTTVQTGGREITPYLLVFSSITSIPLLPPPLARA